MTKLVPFSDSQMSHCAESGYRYCDNVSGRWPGRTRQTPPAADLLFNLNHFWLEPEDSSLCHIGIDGVSGGGGGPCGRDVRDFARDTPAKGDP